MILYDIIVKKAILFRKNTEKTDMYTKKLPELLAPAGDIECLKAAVYAGADAVYFGCPKYNARAFAANFGNETLDTAFSICRTYGVKIYLTFNTLPTEKEFSDMYNYTFEICREYKPDGIIVQDIGLAEKLHKSIGVPIVASTQMALHNAKGAELLKKIGVFRIVAAREMTLADAKKMQDESGLETELFIHGAICVSQSGGCLMSSMIGKRSGNRGECAQPCRLPYCSEYPLSLKDMCLAAHITEIIDAGISSLKIEGRMKDPSYVYAVTSIYRKLLDEQRNATAEEIEYLKSVFSRSGFTDAYLTGKLNFGMFGIRTDEDKRKTSELSVDIAERVIPASAEAYFDEKESSMTLSSSGVGFKAYGSIPQKAEKQPMNKADAEKRLSKTGGSFFKIEKINATVSGNLFMPVGEINALRRKAVDGLAEKIKEKNTPEYTPLPISDTPEIHCPKPSKLDTSVRFYGAKIPPCDVISQYYDELTFIDIPIWREEIFEYIKKYGSKIRAVMPRCVYPEDEENIKGLISKVKAAGVKSLLCSGFSQKAFADGMDFYADFTANANCRASVNLYAGEGFSSLCVSPELKSGAIRAISGIMPLSVIVYGRLPLMHTRCCIVESINGGICKRNINSVCHSVLSDRMGAGFPVIREYSHRSTVYNSVPTYLADKKDELLSLGISEQFLIFTDENESEIKSVIEKVFNGEAPDFKMTRGYF